MPQSNSSIKKTAPFGGWKAPISAETLAQSSKNIDWLWGDRDVVYWIETRPSEKGRAVLMRQCDQKIADVNIDPDFTFRSRVHEYGGRPYCVSQQQLWFMHDGSSPHPKGIYRHDLNNASTDAVITAAQLNFMEPSPHPLNQDLIIAICEDHEAQGEAENYLTLIDSHQKSIQKLAFGADFYAAPSFYASDEEAVVWLSWLEWNHPFMPWDNAKLVIAKLSKDNQLYDIERISADHNSSQFQPEWHTDGSLFFCDDRSGFWQIYNYNPTTKIETHYPLAGECGLPLWQGGMRSYAVSSQSSSLIACHAIDGQWQLSKIDLTNQQSVNIASSYTGFQSIIASKTNCYFIGSNPIDTAAIIALDLESLSTQIIYKPQNFDLNPADISIAEAINWREGDEKAHGFYYPPQNSLYKGLDGERPPLLVKCHGGPTGQTSCNFSVAIQFWTMRGFAVLDVNYRGSTGFGRNYRSRLNHNWGVVECEDVIKGAKFLIEKGWVDPEKIAISGSSAGGYTVLAALVTDKIFKAGCSKYGIGDLSMLASDTHKFESRYLDQLIGPWPESKEIYQQRSPLYHSENISCPVLFLQGDEDKVVPPNQAEAMVANMVEQNIPFAYILFKGEGHGFKLKENIARAMRAELTFYSRIFNFKADEEDPNLKIEGGINPT